MIINSQDTTEWPTIGDKDKFNSRTGSSPGGSTAESATVDPGNSTSSNADASTAAANSVVMATTSQSSGQSQAQTGASLSRMTDNATSQSVIHSSSSANMLNTDVIDQSSNNQGQPWLESNSTSMGWDKKPIHSNPGTPRLDSSQQFTGWGSTQFSSAFNNEGSSSSQWGAVPANNNNMQSTWGSQSPSLGKQQSTSDWGNTTTSAGPSSQWGAPVTSSQANPSSGGESSWGQPKRLPNTGADNWGQTTQADSLSTNQSNPSNIAAQQQPSSSQWNQPTQAPPPSVWQSNSNTAANNQHSTSLPSSIPSNSTASSKQWGATTVSGQSGASPTTSASFNTPSSNVTATTTSTSTPTSWAGAAAKGLPKAQPKPPEPIDPMQLQIEQSINNPDGWGKLPVRQDTSWGKPPEKKKQDDSNQWQAAPNNGTAIWEAAKSSNGQVENDKSTWNQKVAGNNDPNVWNGEGSKGKDNALWDDVSSSKEQEPIDQANTWNAQGSASRTISQSSGGDNTSDNGWSGSNMNRTSPPNIVSSQPASAGISHDPPNWAANGPVDPARNKANRWEGNSGPHRAHSVSDVGGTSYWETSSQKPGSNWNGSKPPGSWSNENGPSTGGNSWMHQNQAAGGGGGGSGGGNSWGDNGMSGNHWQHQGNRKQSLAWDENAGGDFRDRRMFKSESEMPRDDADMGDWNETNSVWSSANGFKQSRRPNNLPDNAVTSHMQQQQPRMSGNSGPGMNGTQNLTKHQMLTMLMQMGFAKDDAHGALIQNDMNLQGAINDLKKGNSSQVNPGPMGDYSRFNPNVAPPMNMNTPYGNNAQANQPIQQSSRHKPNQMRNTVGPIRGNSVPIQQQPQRVIVQQLSIGVQMNNIHPQILNLPLSEQTVRSIHQLVNLQQTYQHHYEQLMRAKKSGNPGNGQQIESMNQILMTLKQQMQALQQPLLASHQLAKTPVNDGKSLDISPLSLNSTPTPGGQQGGSRLGLWTTEKAPGAKQGAAPSSSLHVSHSTPNLQGGLTVESNPWSTATASAGWSGINSPASQFLDNQNESHSAGSSSQSPNHRPIGQSATSNASSSQNSFDIPEFVPGQPWQGAALNKVEDDPNITPGSVARSISVTASGLNSPDWGSGLGKSTWSNTTMSSMGGGDSWSKSSTRPPPGFNKSVNRSVSMPQGPSEKTSAFSPVGSTWDNKQPMVGGSTWLVIRNLTPQTDGATLKTLCSQHGPLLNFFVNQSTGQALVQYATKQEGMKAHRSLNSCVLGNTTIMTEFVDESEAQRILDQRQGSSSLGRSSSMTGASGSAMWPTTNSNMWGNSAAISSVANSTWGNSFLDQHNMPTADGFLASNDYSL